jgi:hypothetical protein
MSIAWLSWSSTSREVSWWMEGLTTERREPERREAFAAAGSAAGAEEGEGEGLAARG